MKKAKFAVWTGKDTGYLQAECGALPAPTMRAQVARGWLTADAFGATLTTRALAQAQRDRMIVLAGKPLDFAIVKVGVAHSHFDSFGKSVHTTITA